MTTLTVPEHGQVTLQNDVLEHLGIRSGGKIRLDLLPDGRAELKAERPRDAAQPRDAWDVLQNFFAGKTNGAQPTIDALNSAISEAGAAAGMSGSPKA